LSPSIPSRHCRGHGHLDDPRVYLSDDHSIDEDYCLYLQDPHAADQKAAMEVPHMVHTHPEVGEVDNSIRWVPASDNKLADDTSDGCDEEGEVADEDANVNAANHRWYTAMWLFHNDDRQQGHELYLASHDLQMTTVVAVVAAVIAAYSSMVVQEDVGHERPAIRPDMGSVVEPKKRELPVHSLSGFLVT
jgi:hypothetical protein